VRLAAVSSPSASSWLGWFRRATLALFAPSLPSDWRHCRCTLRDGSTVYEIELVNPSGAGRDVASIKLDGAALPDGLLPRLRYGNAHCVVVTMRPIARRE
jgi:cellobiose phosphorylase